MRRPRHAKEPHGFRLWWLVAAAITLVASAWIAAGFWYGAQQEGLPRWYWWPLFATATPIVGFWLAKYIQQNDFTSQAWPSRLDELAQLWQQLWSWRDPLGREWQLWFLAAFVGIPAMAFFLVAAPGDTDRLGSAIGLAVTGLIGWLGLKAIDARINRRLRSLDSDQHPAPR